MAQTSDDSAAGKDHFATTHWSVVLAAGRNSSQNAQSALSILCQYYWRPLYVYVRRRISDVHEAHDLTQEFFARLLEQKTVTRADPSRGRFRSFLLTSLKNFLANEWKKENAQKRGGDRSILSLNFAAVDSQHPFEPAVNSDADREFDRQWALELIERVLIKLRQEFIDGNNEAHFEQLKQFISKNEQPDAYPRAAQILRMTESAIRTAAHRMRKRYRELLKREIAQTVANPEDVDEEIRNLFTALGS